MCDDDYLKSLEGEKFRCATIPCGQFIREGTEVYDVLGLPHCSRECLDRSYRQSGIYDLIYNAHKTMHEDHSASGRE